MAFLPREPPPLPPSSGSIFSSVFVPLWHCNNTPLINTARRTDASADFTQEVCVRLKWAGLNSSRTKFITEGFGGRFIVIVRIFTSSLCAAVCDKVVTV